MNTGSNWAILVAVRHGEGPSSANDHERRFREMRQLITRASAIATSATTFGLVKQEFLSEWHATAPELPQRNFFIHPAGAAPLAGITRVLATILARDKNARVILIPADHCAAVESAWVRSAKGAMARIEEREDRVYLLHDQTRAAMHFDKPSEEMCSTTVIVGSAESLLHLSEGRRATKVLDLMTEADTEPAAAAAAPAQEAAERPINLVHVRLVEEYERIQLGALGHSSSSLHVVV